MEEAAVEAPVEEEPAVEEPPVEVEETVEETVEPTEPVCGLWGREAGAMFVLLGPNFLNQWF